MAIYETSRNGHLAVFFAGRNWALQDKLHVRLVEGFDSLPASFSFQPKSAVFAHFSRKRLISGRLNFERSCFFEAWPMLRHFSFAGMQRSGNHAVIHWWMQHFEGSRFRNNILGLSCKDKCAQFHVHGDYTKQVRVDSWENYPPRDIHLSGNSEPLVVILRDPYNWWASWFDFFYGNPNVLGMPRRDTIPMYLKYVEYARDYPNSTVIFNKWFSSPDYRRTLEQDWKLNHSDAGLNKVSELCCGSSFDAYNFQAEAQQMKVLERYKRVLHLPAYTQPLLDYPELADISRELFDLEPPENLY